MIKPLSFGSDGKLLEFTPQISDISGLQTALDGKAATSHTQDWSTITGKPSTFAPASHVHAIADVTSLQTVLDGKAATSHTQAWSTITGTPTTRVGYGITDAAGLGANTFTGTQTMVGCKVKTSLNSDRSSLEAINDQDAVVQLSTYSSSFAGTIFGRNYAGLSALVTNNYGSYAPTGLVIGTLSAIDLVLGANNIVSMTCKSDGKVFFGTDPGGSELLRVGGDVRINGTLSGQNAITVSKDVAGDTFYGIKVFNPNSSGYASILVGKSQSLGNSGVILWDSNSQTLKLGIYAQSDNIFIKNDSVRISSTTIIGTDPGGTELLRVGGSIRCGAIIASIGTTSGLPIITTTNGVLATGAFGSTSGTFCQGNDSRLSDARTPLSHSHVIADVTGLQTALDGKSGTSHTHTNFSSLYLGTDPGGADILRVGGNLTLREDTYGANIKLKYSTTYSTSINTNSAGAFFVQDVENARIFLNYDRSANEVRIGPDLNIRFKTGLFHLRGGTPVSTTAFEEWTGSTWNYSGQNQNTVNLGTLAATVAALIKVLRAQGVIGSS